MSLRKSWLCAVLIAAPYLVAAFALVFAGAMYRRVRAFDAAHHCNVLAGRPPAACAAAASPSNAVESAANQRADAEGESEEKDSEAQNTKKITALEVEDITYDGDRELCIRLNARPDMDVARRYVKVDSLASGKIAIRYDRDYYWWNDEIRHRIIVTGEFAYRTNSTLKILKGFPLAATSENAAGSGALTNDITYVFRRKDPRPDVSFVDAGRYLPPGGRTSLRMEAVSVSNVVTELFRVEPRNVVQLLAREERQYRALWHCRHEADDDDTLDLSALCASGLVHCVNRPCEKETCLFPIVPNDGGPAHGVFLAAVSVGDLPPENRCASYRLVCLSDLGLSVRRHKDGLGVWVTSLTSGKPQPGAQVAVYSSANILIAAGETDSSGWCVPAARKKGEPFAVVVRTPSDMTFIALADSMEVGETTEDGTRPAYLDAAELDAFVWTERGIYRHGEPIFVHAIVRDAQLKAPRTLPLVLILKDPNGHVYASKTVTTDADGALSHDAFAVAGEQPSGKWTVNVALPGKDGRTLASREIKIEEFAPPQIRVNVRADAVTHPTNFAFTVSAEHLFGGPASGLPCEGAVVFEDVPFEPANWKDFTFGDSRRGLKPCFRRLTPGALDENGTCVCAAPLLREAGRPRAAVRATGQGVVFEDGGRPATARASLVCHYYPYYIGSNLPSWLKGSKTRPVKVDFVCVDSAGELVAKPRRLLARIDRIDSVYSYRKNANGSRSWDCERIETVLYEELPVEVGADGRAEFALPMTECGDYRLQVEDPETGVSFGRAFYLSDWGDNVVRAPLSNPTAISISTDKAVYRVGERPHLVVKSPFAGYALLSVLRDGVVYDEVLQLTNTTSEVVLRPVERAWAPNVDVAISVVQSVAASAKRLAARAHGLTTVRVRPAEAELDVKVSAEVEIAADEASAEHGSRVTVEVDAPGATAAVVTLVDEGINLLTDERTPDPVRWFARVRTGEHPLFDLFGRILPVVEDGPRAGGVKTGGDCGAEMLGRVSPVPSRRFKPLALWKTRIDLTDGKGRTVFELPEFVGEVRVTAVAYSALATGAASVQKKVTPKLVLQPDSPRFVAPHDSFAATMTLRNCSAADGEVAYEFVAGQPVRGSVFLRAGASTNLVFSGCLGIPDGGKPMGEMTLTFRAQGLGERHEDQLALPVRPAVAWRSRTDVVRLDPGQTLRRDAVGDAHRFAVTVGASPLAEYVAALDWLAEYPHGCLEQTASRIFPLIAAGGVLNSVASKAATNRAAVVAAGVQRVESMIHENNFSMWPDCTYEPWDREVSLYAAHFLFEAEKAGHPLTPRARRLVLGFLWTWVNENDKQVAAYACMIRTLAGHPEKDCMLALYDAREKLDALSRARLARAFVILHDVPRAEALMKYAISPQSVKEAAFIVLALLDLNPNDERIPKLIEYLTKQRDRKRFCWGTTAENAHALLAIGAYYSHHPVRDGEVRVGVAGSAPRTLGKRDTLVADTETLVMTNQGPATAFLTVRENWLNDPSQETNEASGVFISRRYLRMDDTVADLANLKRGEMLIAELSITSDVTRVVSDLVVEDLFAGAFEPVHLELSPEELPAQDGGKLVNDWVMRKDARDDRMLVFSKQFELKQGCVARVRYPVRVVSAGEFVLPGPSVEAMYYPELKAKVAPAKIKVEK